MYFFIILLWTVNESIYICKMYLEWNQLKFAIMMIISGSL